MRILITLVVFLLATSRLCFSEVIYFKDGRKIHGKIVEKTDKIIRVDIAGVVLTCYPDEIARIEEASTAPAPATVTAKPLPTPTTQQTISPESANVSIGPAKIAVEQTKLIALPSGNPGGGIGQSLQAMNKHDLIMALMDASGTRDSMYKMFNQMIGKASTEDAQKIRELINVDEVLEQLVPVYGQYFTDEDLKGLVGFYRSPLGRKLLLVTPLIVQDSMKANLEYFQKKIPPQYQNPVQ